MTTLDIGITVAYLVNALGAESAEWGTVIWTVQAGGRTLEIWQEYAVLFALPASLMAFVLGQLFGRAVPGHPSKEGARA